MSDLEERIAWVSPSRLAFMRFVFRHFPESFRKWIADNFGYFWKKCPRCEKEFGGFEVAGGRWEVRDVPLIPVDATNAVVKSTTGKVICPDCCVEPDHMRVR